MPDTAIWGYEGPLTTLRGGHRNRAFRTAIGHHPALVFKSSRRSPEALSWLEPVQMAARIAGFEIPAYLPSQRGHILERGWTCEPFVVGEEFTAEQVSGIARILGRFHEIACGIAQRPGFASVSDLMSAEQGGDVDLSAVPPRLVDRLRAAWAEMPEGDHGVIHGDIGVGNLILTPQGQPALIDWDESRVDRRVFDMAQAVRGQTAKETQRVITAWEVACCWTLEPTRARALAARHYGFDD